MKKHLTIAAAVLMALACNKNETITKVFEVTPEDGKIELGYEGEAQVIGVTSNVEWTAEASESWIMLDRKSGNDSRPIYVSATANTEKQPRTGYVTVAGNNTEFKFTVTQAAAPATDPVDPPVDPVDPPVDPVDPPVGPTTTTTEYSFFNAPIAAFDTPFAINSLNWTVTWDGDDIITPGKLTDNESFKCKQFGTENYVMHKITIRTVGLKGKVSSVDVKVGKSGSTSSPLFDHVSVGGVNLKAPENVVLPQKTPASHVFTVESGSLSGDLEILIKESGSDPSTCGIRLESVSITTLDE